MKNFVLVCLVGVILALQTACYVEAKEGEYQVQTVKGPIARVIKPSDGWVWTIFTIGNEEYPFNIRTFTYTNQISGSTKDNSPVKMDISLTLEPPSDDEGIKQFVRRFGLTEDERWQRMTAILGGQLNTEAKNAMVNHDAYALLANQETVQKSIQDSLTPILKNLTGLHLVSVQVLGKPDMDDRIEDAASSVVANGKKKEASEALLAAAKVDAERKQVEAITFANPAMLKIKVLELQLAIEQARAEGIKGHSGTLIMGSMPNLQMQFPAEK